MLSLVNIVSVMRNDTSVEGLLTKRGIVLQEFDDGAIPTLEMHVFTADNYSGEVTESEEMRPQWFPSNQLPFKTMWTGTSHYACSCESCVHCCM